MSSQKATLTPTRYLAVVDFEATCEENAPRWVHEIIEFPIVVVDTAVSGWPVVAEFHEYCRPTLNPTLTDFCRQLTGIQQAQVDQADVFTTVFDRARAFLDGYQPATVVTCGNWDLGTMLPLQASLNKLPSPPAVWKRWFNVKELFYTARLGEKRSSRGMAAILEALGLPLEGRHHSGIDDSRNIARIVRTVGPQIPGPGWPVSRCFY